MQSRFKKFGEATKFAKFTSISYQKLSLTKTSNILVISASKYSHKLKRSLEDIGYCTRTTKITLNMQEQLAMHKRCLKILSNKRRRKICNRLIRNIKRNSVKIYISLYFLERPANRRGQSFI